MSKRSVSIVIPAFNEARNITATIDGISSQGEFEIIVVDDGSIDDTSDRAMSAGAIVVELPVNLGKGKALEKGVERASGEVIVFLDADLAESSSEVTRLLVPVISGLADVTIARFRKPSEKPGGFGLTKGLARVGIRLVTGMTFDSPLSGQRAMRKEVLSDLLCFEQGFGVEVGMTIDLLRTGHKVIEVDTNMSHDETGRTLKGFLHRGRQFKDVLLVLVRRLIKFGVIRRGAYEKVGNN
jgi:glycosyltransferase involved in cell wall biosynthesis